MSALFSAAIIGLIQSYGYVAVFVLMTLESVFIPIPSEITMPFAGFLAVRGSLNLYAVIALGAAGNLVGSLVGYYIGYVFEERVLVDLIRRWGKFVLVTEHDYEASRRWFGRWGSGVVFVSRLLPGVRTFISLPAGMFAMPVWKFAVYTFAGSLVWSAGLAYIGVYLGANWDTLGPLFSRLQYAIAALVLGLAAYYVYRKMRRH